MFKFLWFFILIVFLLFVLVQGGEIIVDLKENIVIYYGKLLLLVNQKFFLFLENSENKVEWLFIMFEGGEINYGMDFGDIVYDYDLKFEVNEYCFLLCVNYVFFVVNYYRILNYVVIGFYGGIIGMEKEIILFIDVFLEEEWELIKQNLEKYMKLVVICE